MDTGLPLLYMCLTIPLGFALDTTHYGSDTAYVSCLKYHYLAVYISNYPIMPMDLSNNFESLSLSLVYITLFYVQMFAET